MNSFGTPKKVICDNGKQYESKIFENWLKQKGIVKTATPIYHPSSNGISERLNQAVAEVLRMYRGKSILEIKKLIEFRLNNNYNRSIKQIPSVFKESF
jgi:transposase InsO family protein